ncbi:hypothetical protein FJR11_18060 [Anabaena sp. UHCC 0187]|uniref:hypothetical protein n=1 Tax=Anabaena sp. UHCC 0187 TaxID=2590018 RepID=UPI0014459D92|nr:hypothetical protein [Anabaena sp. UHCC 0187]MTJ14448.1 hypothetical protein [Anabaena sp. UHCC 0187]
MSIVDSFKQASQKAENFAQKTQLRKAVITAETALSLCQLLSNYPHPQINTWAKKILINYVI